ncbi:MAG: hypothetical protein AMJ64_03360 [Betaproteobacteria bacterium SG8_39]|nr:MAG: hypothetical protein AMJ64_03360 [Betaproteobacteria bacterium SG8_39]
MAIEIVPVTPGFAAEVGDVDLARLTPEELEAVKQAFWTYAVLVFPGQTLDAEQHLAFAARFGPHETTIAVHRPDADKKLRVRREFADVSNLDPEGRIWKADSRVREFERANRLWHTDSSFKRLPALASFLYARSIPPVGGRTEFADLRAAYDALPEATQRRLEGRVAEHCIAHSRARIGFTAFTEEERKAMPPVPQLLVRTLPQSGRKTLYLASHAGRIVGLPEADGRALIDELIAHATQRQFVYSHRWRAQDLVMWDDRCTMHRAMGYDDLRFPRDVQRATVSDVANSCEQEGVQAVLA